MSKQKNAEVSGAKSKDFIWQFYSQDFRVSEGSDWILAQKRLLHQLVKRSNSQTRFVEAILEAKDRTEAMVLELPEVTPSHLEEAREALAKDFRRSSKLNIVIMVPKEHMTRLQNLKSLATNAFKFFF